jgi:acyl transferase domain-containing protein
MISSSQPPHSFGYSGMKHNGLPDGQNHSLNDYESTHASNGTKIPCFFTSRQSNPAQTSSEGQQAPSAFNYEEFAKELLQGSDHVFLERGPRGKLGRSLEEYVPQETKPVILSSLPELISENSTEHFLTALGRLWKLGIKVDWNGLHGGEKRYRVPLPTYPFQRNRHWWGK